MSSQPPDEESSAQRWAARGRGWLYLIDGLLGVISVFYVVEIARNHERLDPWLRANGMEGPVSKIVVILLPALFIALIWWRMWKGSR